MKRASVHRDSADFNEAGRRLLRQAGVAHADGSVDALNVIWRAARGNGAVFIGSIEAASDEDTLRAAGITHIVNCMCQPELNTQPGVSYFDFDVERWEARMPADALQLLSAMDRDSVAAQRSGASMLDIFKPAIAFVEGAISQGGRCLIHCYAGAHRAGTTGVAFLMWHLRVGVDEAVMMAQRARPIVDPKAYAGLHALLLMLEAGLHHLRGAARDEERNIGTHQLPRPPIACSSMAHCSPGFRTTTSCKRARRRRC